MLIFIIAISGALLFLILYSDLKIRLGYVKHDEDNIFADTDSVSEEENAE